MRMRRLAQVALRNYDLPEIRISFLKHAGNTLFRINEIGPLVSRTETQMFVEGQYLLRIHQPGYQTTGAILLELAWLAALRNDEGAPVPEPVPNMDGAFLTTVEVDGVPGARRCSLLRWVKGRFITKGIEPRHFKAQGRLMALLHGHAEKWHIPEGCNKRHYDWRGLFREDGGSGMRAEKVWSLLPPSCARPLEMVARQVQQAMEALGKGSEVCGLIHGDLGVDANILFWRGEARAIDFDDSGIGYWIYDLAVALEHCREDALYHRYRDGLLGGYREIRRLPMEQYEYLELFLAGFQVYWYLWAAAMVHLRPGSQDQFRVRMDRALRLVKRYLRSNRK